MGTSQDKAQAREDIEAQIEECEETIYEYKYALRWFRLIRRLFFIAPIVSIVLLNVPLPAFSIIGPLGLAVALFGDLVLFIFYRVAEDYRENIIAQQKALREGKKTLTKLLRQLARYDERIKHQLPSPERHAENLPRLIATYRNQANRYRGWFITTQIITIFLSAAVTSLSGGWLDRYISLPWIIPTFSASISLLTSFTLFFKFREKGANLQETADKMDLEFKACGLGIDPYNGTKREEALLLLAKRTEALRKEQLQRQQQLEQSSQTEQKTTQTEK